MKKTHILVVIITIIGLMVINSCATTQKNNDAGNNEKSDLDQLLEKAKKNQVKLTFYGNAYNEDNTFSLVNTNGEYNLVLPKKDCFLDIKCKPTCDPTVNTGHSGDHLWLYLQKQGVSYNLNPNDWNRTMISVVEGLIAKGIPVTFKAPAITTKENPNAGNNEKSDLDQLLEKAKNNQARLTFYGNAYNEDNTFSLVNTNGEYNLVLPKKDCFLDIKCKPTCDPTLETGHSGDHLWLYLQKQGVSYNLNPKDWNRTMISVVEGLIAKGIPVTFKAPASK